MSQKTQIPVSAEIIPSISISDSTLPVQNLYIISNIVTISSPYSMRYKVRVNMTKLRPSIRQHSPNLRQLLVSISGVFLIFWLVMQQDPVIQAKAKQILIIFKNSVSSMKVIWCCRCFVAVMFMPSERAPRIMNRRSVARQSYENPLFCNQFKRPALVRLLMSSVSSLSSSTISSSFSFLLSLARTDRSWYFSYYFSESYSDVVSSSKAGSQ